MQGQRRSRGVRRLAGKKKVNGLAGKSRACGRGIWTIWTIRAFWTVRIIRTIRTTAVAAWIVMITAGSVVVSVAPQVGTAQQAAPPSAAPPPSATSAAPKPESTPESKPEKEMTPEQARTLFRSVDTILKFDSSDTGLSIKHSVKRRLTTRKAVEAFLVEKMKEDKDTARVERSAIVLKKFGLLPADFDLRPFLLSLLKEQIAGYYDSKTKTVNLLNWINPEEQKPVLAHELTHALQDQHVNLDKWGDQSIDGTPHAVAEDNRYLRHDEDDTAREAVLEGQAMVAYMDWSLAPMAQSLRTSPDVPIDPVDDKPDPESPILSSAPLVLKASLLFPYQDGMLFEQVLLKDHGAKAAFAAVLDRPPSSSYEIMHPHAYEQHTQPALLTLPDLHPLLDAEYKPYDLGVMGALDVRMLGQLFGGAGPSADLAAGWDGGAYYAAQSKSAVAAGHGDSTASIGLLYLSRWTTPEAAAEFARLYAADLGRKYKQLKSDAGEGAGSADRKTASRLVFSTEEGPVILNRHDRQVFISEGFALPLEAKLEEQMTGTAPALESASLANVTEVAQPAEELSAPLVRLFGERGMMKAGLALTQERCREHRAERAINVQEAAGLPKVY